MSGTQLPSLPLQLRERLRSVSIDLIGGQHIMTVLRGLTAIMYWIVPRLWRALSMAARLVWFLWLNLTLLRHNWTLLQFSNIACYTSCHWCRADWAAAAHWCSRAWLCRRLCRAVDMWPVSALPAALQATTCTCAETEAENQATMEWHAQPLYRRYSWSDETKQAKLVSQCEPALKNHCNSCSLGCCFIAIPCHRRIWYSTWVTAPHRSPPVTLNSEAWQPGGCT